MNIEIPIVKNKRISTKIDSCTNQYIFKTKREELRVLVFYSTLDTLCQGLNSRFQQDTLDLISSVEMLVNLSDEIEKSNYELLSKYFNASTDELIAEVKILKAHKDTPRGTNSASVYHWLDWLCQFSRSNNSIIVSKCFLLFQLQAVLVNALFLN